MATSIVTERHGTPVFHETVPQERLSQMQEGLIRDVTEVLDEELKLMKERVFRMLTDATRKAYADGVRDGFAQGVHAETEARSRTPC